MSIDELGFLSPDLENHKEVFRQKHSDQFGLIEKVVRCCHATKYKLEVHNRDGQEVFSAGLFLKLLADTEAAVLLLERGIVPQARSMLRIALECSIKLANVCRSEELLKAYILLSEHERLKLIKGIKRSSSPDFVEFKETHADDLIKEIKERLVGNPELKLSDFAKEVGMEVYYNAQYRLYSADVHSAPASIESLFAYENDEITSFNWGPMLGHDIRPELAESARLLITGLKLISEVFEVDLKNEVAELVVEFHRLGGEVPTDSTDDLESST